MRRCLADILLCAATVVGVALLFAAAPWAGER